MICDIKTCNNIAIGTVFVEGHKRGSGSQKRITRCKLHEVRYQAWKRRREAVACDENDSIVQSYSGDPVVGIKQIQHSYGSKCVNNINLKLKEIYPE